MIDLQTLTTFTHHYDVAHPRPLQPQTQYPTLPITLLSHLPFLNTYKENSSHAHTSEYKLATSFSSVQ